VPNLPVDVDSWGRSACYPRGTFYPLSDGPSTRNHRITKPDFRPCSTVGLTVKLPYAFALIRTISNRAEGTFGRLRYLLGGDRPSQTAHLTLSHHSVQSVWLEPQCTQSGIPPSAPPEAGAPASPPPTYPVHAHQNTMPGCSKAPRGLSVQPRVTSIFTGTTISPGTSLRQRPSRYAIRAGRNLPDKEFRYLRTVIVTAAVYWGFGSELRLAANPSP
jgi:hypothetical protein